MKHDGYQGGWRPAVVLAVRGQEGFYYLDAGVNRVEYANGEKEYYEGARDQQNRIRWISESKTLHGPFLPTGKATALSSTPTRSLLPDMVRQIHATLRQDWPTCNFSVMVDEEDAIIMRFETRTVDNIVPGDRSLELRSRRRALIGERMTFKPGASASWLVLTRRGLLSPAPRILRMLWDRPRFFLHLSPPSRAAPLPSYAP